MKAMVYTHYGPPELLQLQEVAKPTLQPHQVLVKVQAASVNPLDCWRFNLPWPVLRLLDGGSRNPKTPVLGADLAGQVEAVGSQVKQWRPGDEVLGIAAGSVGAFAEYAAAPENQISRKPAQLSFAAAAAVPVAALTALQALRDHGQLQPGQKVLIQGAAGGVGTFAVQLAKAYNAEVTAVCSPRNLATAHALGATHLIDYTQVDFTRNGQHYDLILAVNGYHSLFDYRRALRPGGICVIVGGSLLQMCQGVLLGPLLTRISSQRLGFMGIAKPNGKDLALLGELLDAGKLVPMIDRCYPLVEVAEALKYVGAGHARGKVVIQVANPQSKCNDLG